MRTVAKGKTARGAEEASGNGATGRGAGTGNRFGSGSSGNRGPGAEQSPEAGIGGGENLVVRVARAWFAGWQAFAGVAGGRAEDLVGGNPWHRHPLPGEVPRSREGDRGSDLRWESRVEADRAEH